MKRPFFFLALLVGSASWLHATQLYDITLSTAEKFTQCQIKYRGTAMTKFTGKNKKGEEVSMEVKTSSILLMKEVKPAKVAEPEPTADEPGTTSTTEAKDSPDTATEESASAALQRKAPMRPPVMKRNLKQLSPRMIPAIRQRMPLCVCVIKWPRWKVPMPPFPNQRGRLYRV